MNPDQFAVELKELRCHADWHKRYYSERARKYHMIDYWLKTVLGFLALGGAALAGVAEVRMYAAFVAGGCAFLIANVIPNFKWDSIVSGFKDEALEWTKIFYGYEDLIRVAQMSEKGEILLQEFQKVREMQKAAALNDRHLPRDQKLFGKCEEEVRKYWGLDA